MSVVGAYHLNQSHLIRGASDLPCIMKGSFVLCAEDVHSEPELLAFALGRIRNSRELADRLDISSTVAQSVLVARAYQLWGSAYPEHIAGPVITGVFDRERDTLVLSRDRMGEGALFFCRSGDAVAFADHPDALIKAEVAKPIVDAAGLSELFALGPARTPGRTPYRDILALDAGCSLIVEDGRVSVNRYFQLRAASHLDDEAETVKRVRQLIEAAVDDIAGLNPASMLSGGIDSTVLTALLCERTASQKSFSVDYALNERYFQSSAFQPERDAPYIAMAVEALGTEHMSIMLSQRALAQSLGEAADARGFPGMADIDSSLLLFCREISPYARSVVSGECGDEVFGGYPWFRDVSLMREDAFPWSGSIALRQSVLHPKVRSMLNIPQYISSALQNAIQAVEPLPGEEESDAKLRTMQQLCFKFFMANLQERALKMCSAAGLTVISPFCDDRLVQYVYNVPWSMKFMGGQEKGLLRAAVGDLLPEPLLKRKKSPYPKTCSPEYTQIIADMTRRMLLDPSSPILEIIDGFMVARIAESELSPTETPWYGQLMAGPQMLAYLLQVNDWMKKRNVIIEM